MRAAAEQHGTLWIRVAEAGWSLVCLRFGGPFTPIRVVFDASDRADSIARDAQRDPSIDIFRLLCADQIQQPKRWRHEKSESPKSSFRSRRQARVHQHCWNSAFVRERDEIWPNFSFNQQ